MFRWPAHVPALGGSAAAVLLAGAPLKVATGFRAVPASPQPPADTAPEGPDPTRTTNRHIRPNTELGSTIA